MLRVIKEGTDEYDLLQDYESFKKYNRKKENNIVNFQLLNYKKFNSAKMTFDTNLIVLLINGCIQNNVTEEIKTMHFLMWLAGTYKITMASLKDLVTFTSNCLENSNTEIFYKNQTMNDIAKKHPNFSKTSIKRLIVSLRKKFLSPTKQHSFFEIFVMYLGLVMVLISIVILIITPDELVRGMRQFPKAWT